MWKVMYYRKVLAFAVAFLVAFGAIGVASAKVNVNKEEQHSLQSIEPLNLAVLIQDDLVSQVANEIGVTKDFIRSLPEGSKVMVGYITTGTLQVRQPFTTDLEKAASSLRIPLASRGSSAFNPYVEVIEALKKFGIRGKFLIRQPQAIRSTSSGPSTKQTNGMCRSSVSMRRQSD